MISPDNSEKNSITQSNNQTATPTGRPEPTGKQQKELVTLKTGNSALDSTIASVNKTARNPMVAHLLRTIERFNDRMGNQFGAAITYFSFLSLIPMLMVSFAAGGYILAEHPTLLEDIFAKILSNVSDPTLAATLQNTINTAIKQRTTVGLVGLLIALYSGINWMGNLREAVRAQTRATWERAEQDKEKIWTKYLRDFISLTGMLVAMIITLVITSISGSAQSLIINILHLGSIEWLRPTWHLVGLAISIFANYLLFFWIFWRLPRHRPPKKALIRGTMIAAVGFEVIKMIMTYSLPKLVSSPSGAAFGSVLGLMAFFYFFARLTLFCAAWIGTAEYSEDKKTPKGKATQ